MIIIESKRKKLENILKKYPGAVIVDVTSKATDGLVKLSPFYRMVVFLCHSARDIRQLAWKVYGKG